MQDPSSESIMGNRASCFEDEQNFVSEYNSWRRLIDLRRYWLISADLRETVAA